MDVGVLGPLALGRGGATVLVAGAQQRALLAVLLARRGRVVAAGTLVDALWGDAPPRTAEHTLHTHVSRLRRAFDLDVVAADGGYLLRVDDLEVDADRFDALVARAGHASAEPATALLEEALGLWRGPAFGRCAELPAVRVEAVRLDEARHAARERLGTALLASGRPAQAAVVLDQLVGDEPFRETAWALLVRALVASGRPADGVAAFARAAAALGELGLRPSADLRAAQGEALRAEGPTGADRRGADVGESGPDVSVPAGPARRALPVVASTFVGRAGDLAAVEELVADSAVTTLVGPGGVGKTRLALEVARRRAAADPAAVRLVELATVADGASVATATLTALGVAADGRGAEAALRRAGALDLLVVLDNCEHVLDEVADVVVHLVRGGGPLRVLATSRERLGLDGEQVRVLAPLGLDGPDAAARQLFRDRARSAGTALGDDVVGAGAVEAVDTADTGTVVDRVVRSLDGLPLAIEMAAARTTTVGLADLADQLEAGVGGLVDPRRDGVGRHRTLAAVIAWSRDLLDDDERAALTDWAVFAGPVRPADAVAVLRTDADVADRLVRRSLLALDVRDGRTRYRMLHTVRSAVLDGGDVRPGLRARHARWFTRVAEEADARLRTPGEPDACRLLTVQVGELRAAHAWAREADPPLAARLTAALHVHAVSTLNDEVLGWAARLGPVLADDDPVGAPVQVAVGTRLVLGGELAAGAARAQRALALAPTNPVRITALEVLADAALYDGRLDDGAELGDRMAQIALALADPHYVLTGRSYAILGAAYAGREDEARERLARLRDELTGLGDLSPGDRGMLAYTAGEIELDRRPALALAHLEQAIALADVAGSTFLGGIARVSATSVRARHGDPELARAAFDEVVRWWLVRGDRTHLVTTLRNLVDLLVRTGADADAARLLGAVLAPGTSVSFGAERDRLEGAREVLGRRLGADAVAELVELGAALDPEDAARAALATPRA